MSKSKVAAGECVLVYNDGRNTIVFGPLRTRTHNHGDRVTIHIEQEVGWTITATPPKKAAKKRSKK